jgi:hypothetical protein
MPQIKIGTWNEPERKLQRGTSLACDYINHLSVAGEYDAFLYYENIWRDNDEGKREIVGVNAKEIVVTIKTNITDGMLYSGFGGNHHPSQAIEPKPSQITLRPYDYYARNMVKDGFLVLDPEFGFLADPWDMEFGAYLEQISTGLHRHFGLDPHWYAKTDGFAERLWEAVQGIDTGDFDGYDIDTLHTAEKMGYIYWGPSKEEKIHWNISGRDFIRKYLDVDLGRGW